MQRKCLIGLLLNLFFLSFVMGCGYRIMGSKSKIQSPTTIAVESIQNRTLYPELEWRVTDAIIMELTNWSWVTIDHPSKADYILSGEILTYRSQIPYTYDHNQNPLEYKLRIEMRFSCKMREKSEQAKDSDDILPIMPTFQEEEIYRVRSTDLSESKRSEWQALEKAIQRMTQRAIDHLIGAHLSCY